MTAAKPTDYTSSGNFLDSCRQDPQIGRGRNPEFREVWQRIMPEADRGRPWYIETK